VTIDLDAIAHNFDAVCHKRTATVMAVVKADAYGHGAVPVARLLAPKCGFFGVSSLAEALELRYAGIQTPILILGRTPAGSFPKAVAKDIRPTIFHYEDALALSDEAVKQGRTAAFHFAVDTGMSRIGLPVTEEAADLCARIVKLPNLHAEGLFSHFATADCADLTKAKAQADRFAQFDAMLRARGVEIPIRHLDNSAGIMNFGGKYEMVRSGIITYGLYPSGEVDPKLLSIRPALQWLSRVAHVKTLPAGCPISYGGTFVTKQETVVATVPVGYADGYRRSLSGKFYVLIHGQRAPILGRICMDQLMVDVTDIPEVAPGEPVVLLGTCGDACITAGELSEAAGSFPYEQISCIAHRVERIYVKRS
jgi:alanine racemase